LVVDRFLLAHPVQDTLKELYENVESHNIVDYIKHTNFYRCI